MISSIYSFSLSLFCSLGLLLVLTNLVRFSCLNIHSLTCRNSTLRSCCLCCWLRLSNVTVDATAILTPAQHRSFLCHRRKSLEERDRIFFVGTRFSSLQYLTSSRLSKYRENEGSRCWSRSKHQDRANSCRLDLIRTDCSENKLESFIDLFLKHTRRRWYETDMNASIWLKNRQHD